MIAGETTADADAAAIGVEDALDPALGDLLSESEAILGEVLGETTSGDRAPRSKRNNRRGRGRDRSAPDAAPNLATPQSGSGPLRKRGPRVLARTMPLPILTPTGEMEPETLLLQPTVPGRKRGIRTVRSTRRILTLDGITVVSLAQADTLLGSVSFIPGAAGVPDPAFSELPLSVVPVAEYDPLPADQLERLPLVAVAPQNGMPVLSVNGVATLPAFLFVNTEVADEPEVAREIAIRQIKRAYEAGVRLFTLPAHLPWKRKAGDRRYDSLDAVLSLVAESAPDALVLPRLIFSPLASWERANPDEIAAYASGETGDVSIGSELFWGGEAKDALRAAIEHLAQSEHAAHVLGVYLEHGEWFQSKGVGADCSPANTNAFRSWLKTHYRNSEVALRAAWYDGAVTFDTAEIPSAEMFTQLATVNAAQPVFLGDRERRAGDFYAYTSDITAQRILRLASAAKEASGGRLAVAASYGYTLEIARPNCGHYALAQVLASPDVDILTAPFSYTGRLPGGSAPLPVPVDSVHLSGKLFVAEDDAKTHLALRPTEDAYNPKIATDDGTRSVHARNVGTVIAKGCGISWMDLWGEGWLDDDATWQHLGGLVRLMATMADMRRAAPTPVPAPHVAVFIDERSFFDMRGDEEPAILPQLIGRHRDVFARAGASVGFYLLSDLLKPEFPESPRLFIFLNAFHLPVAIRTALQNRWQDNGRTFAWLFAPGACESGNIAELGETIGIQLRLQPWGSRTGTVVTEGRFPLTENAKGERFGEEKRVNPSFTVVDPKAQILGEYTTSGSPSLAYRKHPRWQSVFVGERDLPLPLVRGLYRLADVPVVTTDDDTLQIAGDGFVAVHSAQSGGMTLYSPTRAEAAVYDAVTGELLAGVGFGARAETVARATRLLIWAPQEEITARFAVTPELWEGAPPALTGDELPVIAKAFVFEAGTSAPPGPRPAGVPATAPQPTRLYPVELSVSAEDIAQFEAALSGEIALLDKDMETTAEAEASQKKRRRRRRRGGRAEDGVTDESTGNEGVDDEEGTAATDNDAVDVVFDIAEVARGARMFDVLLPLDAGTEDGGEEDAADDPRFAAADAAPTDPAADFMARLFSLQTLPVEEQITGGEGDAVRRLSLDELLPFSQTPDEPTDPSRFDFEERPLEADGYTQVRLESGDGQPDDGAEAEAVGEDSEPELPVGLLMGSGRGRRTRPAGAGGFTTRLRRRAERSPAEGGADADGAGDGATAAVSPADNSSDPEAGSAGG